MEKKIGLEEYNLRYFALSPEQRIKQIFQDFDPERILVTSSFGTTSVYLLDLVHKIKPDQEIYFIDTKFHFKETLAYKEKLVEIFNLKVLDLTPDAVDHQSTQSQQTWLSDPDLCCSINKIRPLELIKQNYDVWISGLSSFQTDNRDSLSIFEYKRDIIKFHPIVDVSSEEMEAHIIGSNLPVHPLKFQGYDSVGCIHCTHKGSGRIGRWTGFEKTECGLHVG